MTKKKGTLRALLASVLALVMCMSMLIGTTFAWFTDSVTSGSNVITAGNLDLEVQYTLDGETWDNLDGADDLFQKGLWEPGHTEVVALKVINNGSLALKFNASMNIVNEVVGKTKDGNDIKLSDILTVSTLCQQANDAYGVGDITLALAFDGENRVRYETTTAFNKGTVLKADQKLLAGDAHYLFIKVDMAETVGNEANHNGTNIPSIEFGVNVVATQAVEESDSFGPDYDKDATYPAIWNGKTDIEWYDASATEFVLDTAEELAGFAELLNNGKKFSGKTVKLAKDMDLANKVWTPIGSSSAKGFNGTFDGQGHTISNFKLTTSSGNYGAGFFGNLLGGATVKNVKFNNVTYSTRSNIVGVVAGYLYGSATFENIAVTNVDVRSFGKVGGILGMAADPGAHTITMTNCSVKGNIGGGYNVGGLIGLVLQGQTVNLTNCDTDVAFYMNDGGYGFTYVQTGAGLMWNYNNSPDYAGVAELYCYYDAAGNEFCMGAAENVNF